MGIVEREIKPMWMKAAAGLYASAAEAEAAWDQVNAMVQRKQREESAAARIAAAERRADREARMTRGLQTEAPTCTRCGTQHRGEC